MTPHACRRSSGDDARRRQGDVVWLSVEVRRIGRKLHLSRRDRPCHASCERVDHLQVKQVITLRSSCYYASNSIMRRIVWFTAASSGSTSDLHSRRCSALGCLFRHHREQREHCSALRAKRSAALRRGCTAPQREISLLREYRTRLIADVVTGKLDVREAAARLPDEVEEPEPLDEAEVDDRCRGRSSRRSRRRT